MCVCGGGGGQTTGKEPDYSSVVRLNSGVTVGASEVNSPKLWEHDTLILVKCHPYLLEPRFRYFAAGKVVWDNLDDLDESLVEMTNLNL